MQQETFSPTTGKTFCLEGQYWRSALYMVVGAVIACGMILVVSSVLVQTELIRALPLFAIMACLFVFGISLLLPRMRIDADGIHRRLFFWYWDFWPWEEFRSGEIREGTSLNSYYAKSKPFWRRDLNLEYYPPAAAETVKQILGRFGLRPQIEVPESITLTVGFQWEFTDEGAVCQTFESTKSYPWDEIRSLKITKLTHDHMGFQKLDVEFEDKSLELQNATANGQRAKNWKGAPAEEIIEFLCVHIPEDRIEVTAQKGPPRSESEAKNRLQKIEKELKELAKLRLATSVLLASLPVLAGLFMDTKMLIFAVILGGKYYWITKWLIRDRAKSHEENRVEINDWLKSEGRAETLHTT